MEEQNMCRSKEREFNMWIVVGSMQVIMIAGIAAALYFVTLGTNIALAWNWSLIVGVALWTAIIFFARGINAFTVNVADFHGCVLSNRFRSMKRPENDNDRLNLKPSNVLEEIGQGIHPRWPWQRPTFIDLRKQITVNRTVTTYSKDNIEVSVDWVMILAALRGYLCFLVQNSEVEAQDILVAGAESRLTVKLNSLLQAEIIEKLDDLRSWFGDVYEGDDRSSQLERQCGLSATQLTLKSAKRSKKFQESAEALAIADNTAKAVEKLLKTGSTATNPITGKQALNAVLASEKVASLEIIDISGLENVRFLGGNLPFGGGSGQQKGRKNKDKGNDTDKDGNENN